MKQELEEVPLAAVPLYLSVTNALLGRPIEQVLNIINSNRLIEISLIGEMLTMSAGLIDEMKLYDRPAQMDHARWKNNCNPPCKNKRAKPIQITNVGITSIEIHTTQKWWKQVHENAKSILRHLGFSEDFWYIAGEPLAAKPTETILSSA